LTVEEQKLSKSLGTAIDPPEVINRYGADALRWWFLRDVPRVGDADFRSELIAARANELADGLGNLINRTIALVSSHRAESLSLSEDASRTEAARLHALRTGLPAAIDEALDAFDLRRAATALWVVISEANRFVSATQPWDLAKSARAGDVRAAGRLDWVLSELLQTCSTIAYELRPFLPLAAERISVALSDLDPKKGRTLFPKVEVTA
jgi:methionyl-tRNA synthetase